jgi:hypothetical protein
MVRHGSCMERLIHRKKSVQKHPIVSQSFITSVYHAVALHMLYQFDVNTAHVMLRFAQHLG